MSSGCAPNLNTILNNWWGSGSESSYDIGLIYGASNILTGQNPPFTATDFLQQYPNFFGAATVIPGCTITGNSNDVTGLVVPGGVTLAPGQLVVGYGIPGGTQILSVVSATEILLTATATQSGPTQLSIYTSPFIPIIVVNLYIQLAQASIFQARWCEMWPMAIALYVAHFCEMWVRSQGQPASTVGQLAAQGLQKGILISKSVDGVSGSYANTMGDFARYGTFAETTFGAQLLSMAAGFPAFIGVW